MSLSGGRMMHESEAAIELKGGGGQELEPVSVIVVQPEGPKHGVHAK